MKVDKTIDYAVLITYIDPTTQDEKNIILDAVNETNISTSSTLTEHPTVDGTPIADHMYRNPIDLTLNGVFSLNGKQALLVDKTGTSLARVEEIFEDIKNLGILCSIVKIKVKDKIPQFTTRINMVLQSITWTERINSLGFTFNFREALRANVQEYDVTPDDRFAPNITYPDASNFSDTLLDWNLVDEEVLKALLAYNLASSDFLKFVATLPQATLIGAGIGAIVAFALSKALIALGLATASAPIIGGIIAGGVAIVIGIMALIKLVKRRAYKIKAFVYYKNAKKRNKEVERFTKFYESVHDKIRSLDGVIKVWNVNENKSQETLLSIDGDYYIFNFEKNNVDSDYAYKLNVSDIDDTAIKCTNTNCAIASFTDGTPTNCVFKTDKSYVYLIRGSESDGNDLTKYFICASQINPVDFSQALVDIIQASIKY